MRRPRSHIGPATLGALTAAGSLLLWAPAARAAEPPAATPPHGAPAPGTPPSPAAPPPAAPAEPPSSPPAATFGPSFAESPLEAAVNATDLTLKMYGDMGFAVRDHSEQYWPAGPNANAYAPGVWNSFFAPRLDLFASADVGKLSLLTETMFEAENNEIGVDVERLQLSYLFANWLRLRGGRTHMAWGYYNDTYHHGNIFELTTSRPFSVNFEDSLGIVLSHNVGVGVDGTFDLGAAGSLRYDADVGNGRGADITSVSLQFAEKNDKSVNVRLRWMPIDGLILGVNAMHDVVPLLAVAGSPTRPRTDEWTFGAHVVYTEHHVLADVEAFTMRHDPAGLPTTTISGGFEEVGYTLGAFTPYERAEYIRFPASGDVVYQFTADSAQGVLLGQPSVYAGTVDFSDLRIGIKWLPVPELALKLEGERIAHDAVNQEIATVKAAFGF